MKLLLGTYPPTSKVYITDTVKTLLENSFVNFNSTIPIINSDGKLVGKISKAKLANWLLEKIFREEIIENTLYMPIDNTDIKIEQAKPVEVFDLTPETIVNLLHSKGDYEIYITHDGKLIGEFSLSSLLYISSWKSNVGIRVEELFVKELVSVEHEASITEILNNLSAPNEPELIGVTYAKNLVGLIMMENLLQYLYNVAEDRGAVNKIKGSKPWVIAFPDFSFVYIDESVSKALRALKRTRDKKFVIVQNRREETLGYISVKDALLKVEDEITLKLSTQRIKER
ncbi:MAG: CBS domain-containing protein [Fervidicoccaceae archaeon]|nr:CBS domain-containing protein [Fervidicoccaceae archaeon]